MLPYYVNSGTFAGEDLSPVQGASGAFCPQGNALKAQSSKAATILADDDQRCLRSKVISELKNKIVYSLPNLVYYSSFAPNYCAGSLPLH